MYDHEGQIRQVCLPTLHINQHDAKSEIFQQWFIYVKHITEYYSLSKTANILGCHLFSRLERLSMFSDSRSYSRLLELIQVLPNAPVLKELRLNRFQVSIHNMEALHAAASSVGFREKLTQ